LKKIIKYVFGIIGFLLILCFSLFIYLFKDSIFKKEIPFSGDFPINLKAYNDDSIEKYKPLFWNKNVVEIFISPNGNNNNDGTEKKPVATVQKARDIIRGFRHYYPNTNKQYVITLLKGVYYPSQTLVLTSEDGGNKENPVIYRGKEGEVIIVDGGVPIDNNKIGKLTESTPGIKSLKNEIRRKVRIVDLSTIGIKECGEITFSGFYVPLSPAPIELFVNDKPMNLARWPDSSFIKLHSIVDSISITSKNQRVSKWKDEKDLWAVGFWQNGWAEFRLPIESINQGEHSIIKFKQPLPKGREFKKGKQWYVINCLSELDCPGEYYIDKQLKILYFILPDDVLEKSSTFKLSHFGAGNNPFLKIDSASYIKLENIIFKDTRASAIEIVNSENISIENCTIQNTGTFAISLTGRNCYLNKLSISNTGAYGININGGDRKSLTRANNVVENCRIHNLGRINLTYASYGVSFNGVGNTVRNCEIYDSPHTAIFFSGNYHLIEKNKIHNVCSKTDDAGAIYCGRDWALRGNTIKYNFIYDINNPGVDHHKGVQGVYIDDCASGVTVFGNIFLNIRYAGVVSGGGRDNHIENNYFINCKYALKSDRRAHLEHHNEGMYKVLESLNYRATPWVDSFPELAKMSEFRTKLYEYLDLERLGIVVNKYTELQFPSFDSDWDPNGCTFKNNIIYKNKNEKYLKDTRTSKARKHGPFKFYKIENNLIEIDPKFVDEKNLNFDLMDDSPAYGKENFVRIPFEKIGPKKSF
jgi:hypothetical protein